MIATCSSKMDYFDFEDAAQPIPDFDLEEIKSSICEADEEDASEAFEALFFDKTAWLPTDPPVGPPKQLTLANNVNVEVVPHAYDSNGVYPMFRAKEPCDLCRRMGLDCFLATRGTMVNGCTCCISLYRECSFTHQKAPKGTITWFPGISENAEVCEGSVYEHKKTMKSFDDSRGRKAGSRFPRDAIKILRQWLSEHSDHPYPNDREKDELKQVTGLKRSQISNWLANARRRGKVRPSSGATSPMLGAIDIPYQQGKNPSRDITDLNPLDRWKASPPENEPASMTAIARAVTNQPFQSEESASSSHRGSLASSRKTSSEDDSGSWMFKAPSISSFDTNQSSRSDVSFASSKSHRSKGSFASSAERRRRRRAPVAQRPAAQNAKSRSARIFQCTFCADSFPAKYDWQRHEKSLHLALERWTCCPNGPTVQVPLTGCVHCVFCQEVNPSVEHLESHNFAACHEKTLQERTFYRKDHLRQHLKLAHDVKFDASMEAWKSTTNEIKSSCGFCPSIFSTWQARVEHLAAHFRNGADMSQWTGTWGFEPFVERLVENAVPPYLLGFERASMEPFIAKSNSTPGSGREPCMTHGTSIASNSEPNWSHDSNCWGRLGDHLGEFIQKQKAVGNIPTDEDLQNMGRRIIFDDEDPWNQTAADNHVWLETLKFQNGISGSPDQNVPHRLEEVPIMAPYVVKGGLKNKTQSSTQKPLPIANARSFMSEPTQQPMSGSYDPVMDIDFGQLDFSELEMSGTMDPAIFDNTTPLEMDFDSTGILNGPQIGSDLGMLNGLNPMQLQP